MESESASTRMISIPSTIPFSSLSGPMPWLLRPRTGGDTLSLMAGHGRSCAIEVKRLVKAYGDNRVICGIDLEIRPGELLVLVGPSGCGKSTLLRCIAGLEGITSGDLFIDGRRANDVLPRDRDLAMVFQSYALYPHMTVAQNMAFSLTVRKMGKAEIESRVKGAAERLGLTELLGRLPKQLSGGQRQRVAVGRAIVRQPRGFLFDEPLSNLDASLRGQMRVQLKKLHSELGVTMVYVTHDQVEAMTLADRIAIIEGGHVRQVGTPEEIYERPSSRFVAGFIGSPPMNFFDGTMDPFGAVVRGNGFEVAISPRFASGEARRVTVGIRPTGLVPASGPAAVDAIVQVVERLGWESYVHVLVGDVEAVAQVESQAAAGLAPDSRVGFDVAPASVHLFDDRGEALRR